MHRHALGVLLALTLGVGQLAAPLATSAAASERGPAPAAQVGDAAPRVVVLSLAGTIQPATLRFLERCLARAADLDAALVVIELDTPGGLIASLRKMTTAITRSPTPVAVLVTPAGARAASAGFVLLLAADVAAMAPGTNAGAAHPVMLGRDRSGERDDRGEGSMDAKATEDAAAMVRALAEARGRAVAPAEAAVRDSRAYSAREARALGLIDLVVEDRDELLAALDGTTVRRLDGSPQRLALAGAQVVEVEPTRAERLLMVLADPQVAYLLLMLGLLGVLVELMSPGIAVAGLLGGASVLLSLYAFSVLPVSWVGVLLLAGGLALLIAEVFVTSHGLLAVGGTVGFVLGSLLLVEGPVPELRIGVAVVAPVAAVLAFASLFVVTQALGVRGGRPRTGLEAMIGEVGEVTDRIAGKDEGHVFVHGELWSATADGPVSRGAKVRVERVEGYRLRVVPVAGAAREETS